MTNEDFLNEDFLPMHYCNIVHAVSTSCQGWAVIYGRYSSLCKFLNEQKRVYFPAGNPCRAKEHTPMWVKDVPDLRLERNRFAEGVQEGFFDREVSFDRNGKLLKARSLNDALAEERTAVLCRKSYERRMPSFRILPRSVLGLRPSIAAAPFFPSILHPVFSSAWTI